MWEEGGAAPLAPLWAGLHWWGLIVEELPLNFWLIVKSPHKEGHQLEHVLPRAQEDVQVKVTDIHLAVYPCVIHITHALKTVHVIHAEAAGHAWA